MKPPSIIPLCALISSAALAQDLSLLPSRADEQQRQAEAVLYFDGEEELQIQRPAQKKPPFPLMELAARMNAATSELAMIVVIMGKSTQMAPDDRFKAAVDDLEARLRKIGFKKVVFHLATGGLGTPIFRE